MFVPAIKTLTDVSIASPVNNQGLSYNSTTGKWQNANKVYVDANGNVGIGTNNPGQKLEVSGNVSIIGGGALLLTGASNPFGSIRLINPAAASGGAGVGFQLQGTATSVSLGDIGAIWEDATGNNAYMSFNTRLNGTSAEKVRITSGGKVGIGTPTPKAILHGTGSTILGCASSAAADADMGNNQINLWVNEATNTLTFKVKYSTGVIKTGTLALT